MKIIHVFLLPYILCTLLVGYIGQKGKQELPVVDLGKTGSGGKLKISEILDNVRLIRLETTPEALLPGFFYAWLGDKYIVILGQEEIHLFTADGKYIRKVAQHGRGPEEFLYILGFWVDESKDRLYLSDGNRGIAIVDLNEGKVLRKIPVKGGTPHKLLLGRNDILTYIPIKESDQSEYYDVCQIKIDGTFMGGIPGVKRMEPAGMPYLGEINDTIYYKLASCDTLYRLENSTKIPVCRIVVERPYSMKTGEGESISLEFENKDLFILANTEIKVKTVGEIVYTSTQFLGFYMFSKSNYELKKIDEFYLDILDYTDTERFPFLVAGRRAYRNINVSKFKDLLKNRLDSPLIADSLKTWYHELAEDDNPLILVGDIK